MELQKGRPVDITGREDKDILAGEYVGCHPCVNTSSLRIKTKDLIGTILDNMNHNMTVVRLIGE